MEKVKEIAVSGKVTYQQFLDKEKSKIVDYVAIDLNNPFEEGVIRVHIKHEGPKAVFNSHAKKALELQPLGK